jgi:hypothetical protein
MGTDVMRVSIDIPLTERENALPLLALLDQPLVFEVSVDSSPVSTRIQRPEDTTIADEKRPKKQPRVSGPYRYYWEVMHDKGLQNWPNILEVLDCTPDQVWDRLHVEFEVETMSVVSPPDFVAWVRKKGLPEGLITLSANAQPIALLKEEEAKRKAEGS